MINLYQYREDLKKQNVYLSITGPFSQILMEGIANGLKQRMKMENLKPSTIMDVFSVVVEQVQNIIRYSADIISGDTENRSEDVRVGTLVIGYEDEHFFVLSGNLIENSKVEPLRERLTALCYLNSNQLKQLYKKERKKPTGTGVKGAGIGLIEIARTCNQPLEFDFQKIDEQVSFFSIKAII